MELDFKYKNYGRMAIAKLICEADNFMAEEDIISVSYVDWEPVYDISTSTINNLAMVLSDIMYHREQAFDSSTLIRELFEKLPEKSRKEVIDWAVEKW